MKLIERASQLQERKWDPFTPLQRVTVNQLGMHSFAAAGMLDDDVLDGIELAGRSKSANWIDENQVHKAHVLSKKVPSTRFLLGAQVVAVRDDARRISHFLYIEENQLSRVKMQLSTEVERFAVHIGEVRRAHLAVNKYSGDPFVLYAALDDSGSYRLYLNGIEIPAASHDIDFPFMAFSQAPIGHPQADPPPYGMISYKCRTSGEIFVRNISKDGVVGPERRVGAPPCLGGMDFAIQDDKVLFRVDSVTDGKLIPRLAISNDRGLTLSAFDEVNLGGLEVDEHLPATGPVFTDFLGNFHVPVGLVSNGNRRLFDVMEDIAVEAMTLSTAGFGFILAAFPKKPGMYISNNAAGRGDGSSDGMGIIASASDMGRLFSSNSQTGGLNYPQERLLNFEMPKLFIFKATDICYTRGVIPNTVSMDYMFLECDDVGAPISTDLLLETWDMQLPPPLVEASAAGNVVVVRILKDAWFEQGQSIFNFDDPNVRIVSVVLVDGRTAEISTTCSQLVGKQITFETKNNYYWHQGAATIS